MKITKAMLGILQPQMVKYLAKVKTNLIFHGVITESQENVLVQNVLCLLNLKNKFSNNHQKGFYQETMLGMVLVTERNFTVECI